MQDKERDMLVKCEVSDSMTVVSSAGPIDCAGFSGQEAGRGLRAGFSRDPAQWKASLGGMAVLAIALFLLVVFADEAMDGGMMNALLASISRA